MYGLFGFTVNEVLSNRCFTTIPHPSFSETRSSDTITTTNHIEIVLKNIPATPFSERHLGSNEQEISAMLKTLDVSSLDQLIDSTVPDFLRYKKALSLPGALSETAALKELREIARRNRIFKSYLGMGYSDCHVPAVILRNILENPGWYTQYTPYQAEIAQGRLEALLNFQTMVCEMTDMDMANASLLDEGTAAVEAMSLCHSACKKKAADVFLVSDKVHPQSVDVLRTRIEAKGWKLRITSNDQIEAGLSEDVFAFLAQYPDTSGAIQDWTSVINSAHDKGILAIIATDLLALTLMKPPGQMGADVVLGNSQRFGTPLGYGGPHAAFIAVKDSFKRNLPGRLVGVAKDSSGKPAYRLALQTREQHIRREKATSNICTAQALLAITASMYAVYHGPDGLKRIAARINELTQILCKGIEKLGFQLRNMTYFDTIVVQVDSPESLEKLMSVAEENRINLRKLDSVSLGIALDETTTMQNIREILEVFHDGLPLPFSMNDLESPSGVQGIPDPLLRTEPCLKHSVFKQYHTETELLRYIYRLQSRDLSLAFSMIPLGSCTMKLNATSELIPMTWPEFGGAHPFAPASQLEGYRILFQNLEEWLAEITGFHGVSLQPNSGAQGEYAGLLVIRRYLQSKGEGHRKVCLIPTSAHGTNPASAVLAGLKVVPVPCDEEGNIDVAALKAKAEEHSDDLAALMVTYPSTHGVFEESIQEVCEIIHQNGGQVYMDGANLNAQVGLCRPGEIGADVCHLNLHKTFCIPHGGGGPGMGPIAVARHLTPFLPGHATLGLGDKSSVGAVAAAPFGSPSILPISWMYIRMMGSDGLKSATELAILNANYIANLLQPYYPVLYRGKNGRVAHECIIDLRGFKQYGIEVEDVAKRLIDYGFHAPTISWPQPGTMMIEPTESESKEELDRFCEAMISIHGEIMDVAEGRVPAEGSPLKLAPHTAEVIATDNWDRPYSREKAVFPTEWTRVSKFWPHVGRVDNVYGDRNLVCTCPSIEELAD